MRVNKLKKWPEKRPDTSAKMQNRVLSKRRVLSRRLARLSRSSAQPAKTPAPERHDAATNSNEQLTGVPAPEQLDAAASSTEQPTETPTPEWDDATVYTRIALSLARGYTDLYYVNMDTDEFIEFHTDDDWGVLTEARKGSDFFEGCERDAKLYVHPDDQAAFVEAMNHEFLMDALRETNVFELVYRKMNDGKPFYVRMKVSRMEDDDRIVVLAVADVDEQVKQRRAEERMIEDRTIYARLHALTGNYICVYVVVPETGRYREFSSTAQYEESLAQAKEGTDFFNTVREAAVIHNHPDDVNRFLSAFTRENVMAEIERTGIFSLGYRLIVAGKPMHVQLRAAMVEEKEGRRLVVGLNDVDAQVRQQEEFDRRLAQAQIEASIDALTGVKNKYSYMEAEARLDLLIAGNRQPPFAVVVLDVNDLKKVNDTAGHQAGDRHIREACRIICDIFKRSPVFRIGGDEFAVISQGSDYEHIEELLAKVGNHNVEASRNEGVIIACGMAKFENDTCVASVFERADRNMYENKSDLKAPQSGESALKYVFAAERRSALESLRQPFAVYQYVGKQASVLVLSDGFCNLLGYTSRNEAVYDMDNDRYKCMHPDDVARVSREAARFASEGGTYDVSYRMRKRESTDYIVIRAMGEHVREEDGTPLIHVWYTSEGPCEEA